METHVFIFIKFQVTIILIIIITDPTNLNIPNGY